MKRRTHKQLRADLSRIKLEGKTLKQQMKTIANQYSKIGKTIPKKIRENRATQRDIRNYMSTLINFLDNKIEKHDLYLNNNIQKALKELNQIQRARHIAMSKELEGYDKQFIKGFLSGKVAVLGRDSITSVVDTNSYDLNRIQRIAELNKISPVVAIKQEIKAMKKALNDFKNDSPQRYILEQIKTYMSFQGYNLSDKNIKEIQNKAKSIDWLGSVRVINAMESRIDKSAYEIYKGSWDMNDNRLLMQIILEDLKRARHSNMVQYVRLIE